jgi:putative nucleotidyltransferase with HDIG domain
MEQPELIGIEGSALGTRWSLPQGRARTIGRGSRNDIVLVDEGVSRQHCRIEWRTDGVLITDLGSSNGTRVNGERVLTRRLADGDRLRIGDSVYRFSACGGTGTPDREPPVRTEVQRRYNHRSEALDGFARSSPDLPRVVRGLEAFCRLSAALDEQHTVDGIGNATVEAVQRAVGAMRTALLLRRGDDEDEVVASRSPDRITGPLRVSRTILDSVMGSGTSLLSSDVTTDRDLGNRQSVLAHGIRTVMCVPLRHDERVIGALYADSAAETRPFGETDLALLSAMGRQAAVAIERTRLVRDLENLFAGAMHAISASLEAKDTYTGGHSERVTALSMAIAAELDLPEAERDVIELGGLLHDIGKIGVPEAVLRKPGRLTPEEFDEIRKHPGAGAAIVQKMPEIDRLVSMADIVSAIRHHHERMDGRGYPDGLAGVAIPRPARILAVADTYDAVTSDRPYRPGAPADTGYAVLREAAGTQLDPEAVAAFLRSQGVDLPQPSSTPTGRFRVGQLLVK